VRQHICTLLLCFACPGLRAAAPTLPSYFLRVWQTEDGLPENVMTAIAAPPPPTSKKARRQKPANPPRQKKETI